MRFDVNPRSRIIWHRSKKRRIRRGTSATTSRGVLEEYSSQKPQFADGKAKGHPVSRAYELHAWMDMESTLSHFGF